MEREAYEKGNMCFRDWEDSIKNTIYYEHLHKGENRMSTQDWKNGELTQLLSEAWGFKFDTELLSEKHDPHYGEGGHEYRRDTVDGVEHRAGEGPEGHYKDYEGPSGGNMGDISKTRPGHKDYEELDESRPSEAEAGDDKP